MKNNIEKNLYTRRLFFKKAAKEVLPILGCVVLGEALLSSCDPDDGPTGCNGSCSDVCTGCGHNCSGTCDGDCVGSCFAECSGSAKRYI